MGIEGKVLNEEISTHTDKIRLSFIRFKKEHPDSEHTIYEHSQEEKNSICRAIYFLINTQNGRDIDDGAITDRSPLLRYFDNGEFKNKDVLVIGTGVGREMVSVKEQGASYVAGTTLGARNRHFANEVLNVNPSSSITCPAAS